MSIRVANKHDVTYICNLVKSLSYFYIGNNESKLPDWFSETITQNEFC